jgi:hypothetical protein
MIRMNYQTKYQKDNENKSKVESQSQKINNTIVISTLLLNSSSFAQYVPPKLPDLQTSIL